MKRSLNEYNKNNITNKMVTSNRSFLIYVIDDRMIHLNIIRNLLEKNNFRVVTQKNVERGITEIKSLLPDLIILDADMPKTSGFEACRLLKSYSLTQYIPIIFLISRNSKDDRIKDIELGYFDYINKPIKSSELLARVNNCIRLLSLTANLEEQNKLLKAEIDAKRKVQIALEESEKALKIIINNNLNAMIIVDNKGHILFLNDRAESLFNRSSKSMLGENLGIPLHVGKVNQLEILRSSFSSSSKNSETSLELVTVEVRCVPIIWNSHNAYLISATDITEQKKMEEKLHVLFQASEQSPASIMIMGVTGKIEYVNPKFLLNSGYEKTDVIGREFSLLHSKTIGKLEYQKLWQTINNGKEWCGEFKSRKKNNDIYWEKILISPIFNDLGNITHYIVISEDISKQKYEEINLLHQAKYDTLTQIPNRNYGLEKVNNLLKQAQETNSKLGLMFIDLDRFKQVNDSLGHDYGDELLIQVTQRIKSIVRQTDLFARLGGDEFFMAIPFLKQNNHLETIAEKIIDILKKPFTIFKQSVCISGSIGIAIYPQDGTKLKQLIRKADLAMYKSKKNGKNQFQFYHCLDRNQEIKTSNIKQSFSQAITNQELKVVYQPVVEISSQRVVCTEALVRWESDKLGLVYPESFIPLIEKNGMILELENWLLKSILTDVRKWQDDYSVPVSINISEYQLKDRNLFDRLNEFITKNDNFSDTIHIEIKEEMLVERKYLITKMILDISRLNINLCLDNFAGSFSSLAQLNNLKIQYLKIDSSLIHQLPANKQINLLVESIITVAKILGIKVVAKGIETQEQYQIVKDLQCDYAQGYFFSKPLAPEDLLNYLATQNKVKI